MLYERENILESFVDLGRIIGQYLDFATHSPEGKAYTAPLHILDHAVAEAAQYNPWFTRDFVLYSLNAIQNLLERDNLYSFYNHYMGENENPHQKIIGAVMAGNIPLVGFHDFLCILLSGHLFFGKLSSGDRKLLPALAHILTLSGKDFKNRIRFTEDQLKDFDAIIATGSDNTSRYFQYYFGKYPHIIRKNRNGVAVINGNEADTSLELLAEDIFTYFGLGCRNVSKVFIPLGYEMNEMMRKFSTYEHLMVHNKYHNNYEYHKSVFIVNSDPFKDNGYLLAVENDAISSPVSVVYYEFYTDMEILGRKLHAEKEKIQCIVTEDESVTGKVGFGQSQYPDLFDFADKVDTMQFLLSLGQ